MAISSSSIAVAGRCVWTGPSGVVATQNLTNPASGFAGQNLLRQGIGAAAVLELLLAGDPDPEWRQVAVIDRYSQVAAHSGKNAFLASSVTCGTGVVAMGNLLASSEVTREMIAAFENNRNLALAERLLRALEAGLTAGGEIEPVRSAGLQVCGGFDWPQVNLRVDWDETPIGRLREIWTLYEPQEQTFVAWAKEPGASKVGDKYK